MRSGILLCLIAFVVVPTVGRAELQRVVFCTKGTGVCAKAQPLGRAAGGFWSTVGNSELLAGQDRLPLVLYFHAEDLKAALDGLGETAKKAAIANRRELVSEHPETWTWAALDEDLYALAAALPDAPLARLGMVVDAASALVGGERFDGLPAEAAASMVLDELVELLAELPAGPLAADYGKSAAALAKLKRPGAGKEGLVLPAAESEAVYFVPSSDGLSIRELNETNQFPKLWNGGVVLILSPRDLARVPFEGQLLRKLYVDDQLYIQDIMDLTPAQLDRRLKARLRAIPSNELAELVASRAFRLAKLFRQLETAVRGAPPSWLEEWRKATAMGDENLRAALVAAHPHAGKERARRLGTLRADLDLAAVLFRGSEPSHGVKRARKLLGRALE